MLGGYAMDRSYIGIYEQEIEKTEYRDLREQVAHGAFRKMSGCKSDCILKAYTFTYERPSQGYTAYLIKGPEAKTLIQLARPPELFLDGGDACIDAFKQLGETIAIFSTFSQCIEEANYLFEAHSDAMESQVGFAYPAYGQSHLQQIDDALPHAGAALRSHLRAQFERYSLDL